MPIFGIFSKLRRTTTGGLGAHGAPWAPWGPMGPHRGPIGAQGGPRCPRGPKGNPGETTGYLKGRCDCTETTKMKNIPDKKYPWAQGPKVFYGFIHFTVYQSSTTNTANNPLPIIHYQLSTTNSPLPIIHYHFFISPFYLCCCFIDVTGSLILSIYAFYQFQELGDLSLVEPMFK